MGGYSELNGVPGESGAVMGAEGAGDRGSSCSTALAMGK